MKPTKEQILTALRAWIAQRPGLEFGNYGEVSAYRSEMRRITRQRHDAETILRAVELRESITADAIVAAFPRAYSGRLSIEFKDGNIVRFDYCTGQYWPTEYRAAAAAVLASVLWEHVRAHCMPAPKGRLTRKHGPFSTEHDNVDGLTPGDWIRRFFRREFGRSIASRWFD